MEAFAALKQALSTGPVLQMPDFERQFVVVYDASGTGFGAVLHQGSGPLAFFSRPFAARCGRTVPELIRLKCANHHHKGNTG